MNGEMFKRGFKAVKEEEVRREKLAELKKGRLFRFYVPKDKKNGGHIKDIPVIFLTEEPVNYWEHSIPQGGNKFLQVPCSGAEAGCKYCELPDNMGGKSRFVSAWLIVDRTEFKYTDQQGKEIEGKDRIKLLVRGMTDAAILENKSAKFGLMKYDWTVTKVGQGTSSSMQFERGEKLVLTTKQRDAIMSQLPEDIRGLDPYEIIERQLMNEVEMGENVKVSTSSDDDEIDEDAVEKVREGVQSLEDDEEEETPKQKSKFPRKKLNNKK